MLFANKEEEVLDVQLTPHGRYLLSIGRMKPVYYSFHDQNILYDGRYANVTEYTKDTEDRIQHDTPQMKTITSRLGRDKVVKRIYEPLFDLPFVTGLNTYNFAAVSQATEQKNYLVTNMLGSSQFSSDKCPKWSIKVLNGEISGSLPHLTSSHQTLRIPQIDVDIKYKTAIFNTSSQEPTELPISPDPVLNSRVFEDGTYVVVQPDHLLLEILEENSNYNKTNFEIEVFEIVDETMAAARGGLAGDVSIAQNLKPLFFEKKVEQIQNNILLDRAVSDAAIVSFDTNKPRAVKYYFDVLVDNEIDRDDICKVIPTLESKSIFVDLDISCAPDITPTRYDIYSGPATSPCPADGLAGATGDTGPGTGEVCED